MEMLLRTLPVADRHRVEIHLEADLDPDSVFQIPGSGLSIPLFTSTGIPETAPGWATSPQKNLLRMAPVLDRSTSKTVTAAGRAE